MAPKVMILSGRGRKNLWRGFIKTKPHPTSFLDWSLITVIRDSTEKEYATYVDVETGEKRVENYSCGGKRNYSCSKSKNY